MQKLLATTKGMLQTIQRATAGNLVAGILMNVEVTSRQLQLGFPDSMWVLPDTDTSS